MKTTTDERELVTLQLRLVRAKLHLNTTQLARTRCGDGYSPAALLATAIRSRRAWQRWARPTFAVYLTLAQTVAYLINSSLRAKK